MRFSTFGTCDDALHENARRVDVVGIDLAGLDQFSTSATVIFAAVAIIGLKLRAVLR